MSESEAPQPTPTPPSPTPQPFQPQYGGFGFGMQQALPNATAVLVLGIVSIVLCCCYGLLGLIPAIIALVLAKKDRALYQINPVLYTPGSYNNLNAGRVCAIIGLVLNILALLYFIVLVISFGSGILSDPEKLQEMMKSLE